MIPLKKRTFLVCFATLLIACPDFEEGNRKEFSAQTLQKQLKSALDRNAKLAERAKQFDQTVALGSVAPHAATGYSYRFDDHLSDATVSVPPSTGSAGVPTSVPLELFPAHSTYERRPDGLRIDYKKGDVLRLERPVEVPENEIAEIEIRVRVHRIRHMQLGWSAHWGLEAKTRQTPDIALATVDTIPDGHFHTYRVNAATLIRRRVRPGDSVRDVFLRPSETEDDDLEIESIRFVFKHEKYNNPPYGTSYEDIAHEWRRVMYTGDGVSLKFDLVLPDEDVQLRTGFGAPEKTGPRHFEIFVRSDGETTKVLDKAVSDPTGWYDADLDLSKWKGKPVEIEFLSKSSPGEPSFWSSPHLYQKPLRGLNILVLLQDTLRADHLSTYGYERTTSPALDAYARRGAVFERAYSQASKTRPSIPSLMTGLYPTATGVWDFNDALDERYVTLAEVLRSQGFVTASFVPNGNAGLYAGLQQGFDQLFDDYPESAEKEERINGAGADTAAVIGDTLYSWLNANRNRNFFAYVHVVDPHGPYDPPAPHDAWFREDAGTGSAVDPEPRRHDPEWYTEPTDFGRRALYDGEIRNNDDYVAELLSEMKKLDLLDDTLMVFVSDHGEHLGDHDLWEHHPPGYAQVLHVPLIMVFPGVVDPNRRITENVQLVDVLPTVLELAGIASDFLLLQGDSLVPLLEGGGGTQWEQRPVISDEVISRARGDTRPWGSIFVDRWHVLSSQRFFDGREWKDPNTDPATRLKIYDRIADPQETSALSEAPYEKFGAEANAFLGTFQEKNGAINRILTENSEALIRVDPETRDRLRALGYFD